VCQPIWIQPPEVILSSSSGGSWDPWWLGGVLHILRCSPCVSHSSLHSCLTLYSGPHYTTHLCNSDFSDPRWLQANLPVIGMAAWGWDIVSSLALPAYLASAASTVSVQNEILSGMCRLRDSYLSSWSDSFGDLPEALPAKQSVWDRHDVAADRALVELTL